MQSLPDRGGKKIYQNMNRNNVFSFLFLIFSVAMLPAMAQQTEVSYLSGTDCDHTVDWQFYCTDGMNSGIWTTIPVPSNWELQGFGKYNYGKDKDEDRGKEKGLYRYSFTVPREWKNKQVEIVFEGSMTDTEVKINGKLAGPVHRGAFYQFRYDISDLLKYGKDNLLEVAVSKHSTNESVNRAERHADFWIFGGIYRPVYLEVKPEKNIDRVAVDARADGRLKADVYLTGAEKGDRIRAQAYMLDGKPVGPAFELPVPGDAGNIRMSTKIDNIVAWNPENPQLYNISFDLISKERTLHTFSERIGFRTIEVKQRDGIYVNGVKIKFKGINHHVFWPETGRASSKRMSINDVNLIKDMNLNAVRCSHYPPDRHFLDVCDSLGLFVLDELTGWHDAYDTEVGSGLAKEMVIRDVNHPSVVIWDNGNEGGTNPDLDAVIKKWDIQNRPVLHPWQTYEGIETQHYRNYDYGAGTFWHGHNIVLPTEFLHGLYDGGLGSGLYDYWEYILDKPRAAGGFLWVFADEGVIRTDRNGEIDTDGSSAPDGLLGPHHEKEGSFFAVKEIMAPIKPEERDISGEFTGEFTVENRFFYTGTEECSFSWRLSGLPGPDHSGGSIEKSGKIIAPEIAPGHKGILKLDLPSGWYDFDVLYIKAEDPFGREIYTWSYPIKLPVEVMCRIMDRAGTGTINLTEEDSTLIINAGPVQYTIGKNDGLLKTVTNEQGIVPFNNGPAICAGRTLFKSIETKDYGDSLQLIVSFDDKLSRMMEFTWTFYPSGWVRLGIIYRPEEYDVPFQYMGVSFDFPENLVKGIRWMGDGPYRVWKNRVHGVELNVHQKDYNNTMTGIAPLIYPEFKGYHSGLYWAEIRSEGQSFMVGSATEDVFLRLFTPAQPASVWNTAPPFPPGDISFMQAIPAMGTKSNKQENMGPSGQLNQFFDYGPYDSWRKRSQEMELYFNFTSLYTILHQFVQLF